MDDEDKQELAEAIAKALAHLRLGIEALRATGDSVPLDFHKAAHALTYAVALMKP